MNKARENSIYYEVQYSSKKEPNVWKPSSLAGLNRFEDLSNALSCAKFLAKNESTLDSTKQTIHAYRIMEQKFTSTETNYLLIGSDAYFDPNDE
jgi:hypothetical protein